MNAFVALPMQPATNDISQFDNAPIVSRIQNAEQRTNCLREILEKARSRNVDTVEKLQQLFERQKNTRRAYIQALHPNGPFTHAFAELYLQSIKNIEPNAFPEVNPASQERQRQANLVSLQAAGADISNIPSLAFLNTPLQAALEEVQSYVVNRRDEQVAMLTQLEDPKFFQEAVNALATGYVPPPKKEGLSDEKKKILVDELVQLNGLNKREPAIHIRMTARGHEHGHWALAKALDPKGPLQSVLAGALAPHATHLKPEEITKNAHDFLAHFEKLAVQVAEAMTWNGEIVTEAIRQSEASRLKSGVVVPVRQTQSQPTAAVTADEQAARKVFSTWVAGLFSSSQGTTPSLTR